MKFSTMQFANGHRVVCWHRDSKGRYYKIHSRELSQEEANKIADQLSSKDVTQLWRNYQGSRVREG